MVRLFAACLGCIAMLSQILLGLAEGVEPETILVQGEIALLIASAVGWIIGKLTDALVRESIATRVRGSIQQHSAHSSAFPRSN
jgi:predicted lysophospholipase L1 biosynthesis ABC-type transport system permease subunit